MYLNTGLANIAHRQCSEQQFIKR